MINVRLKASRRILAEAFIWAITNGVDVGIMGDPQRAKDFIKMYWDWGGTSSLPHSVMMTCDEEGFALFRLRYNDIIVDFSPSSEPKSPAAS